MHIVQFAFCDADKRGDGPAQVQERVHLHRGFVAAKTRSGEERQTQVDGGGIQRIQGFV
jgi:hypothetical protein